MLQTVQCFSLKLRLPLCEFNAKFFNFFARLFILLSVQKVSYIGEQENYINKRAKKLKNFSIKFRRSVNVALIVSRLNCFF